MSIWHEYLELIQDPAHLMLEATNVVIVDVVIGLIIWPLVKRFIKREHSAFDVEHGISHEEGYEYEGKADNPPLAEVRSLHPKGKNRTLANPTRKKSLEPLDDGQPLR